jgi:photosystem II stability/assembly factor-like uncharacterized protein
VTSITTSGSGALYAGLSSRGVYRWSPADRAWRWRSTGIKAPGVTALAVAPSEERRVYAGGSRSGVARSSDGGASWRWVGLRRESIWDLAVHPSRPGTVFAAGRWLYRSRDGGTTWKAVLKDPYIGFAAVAIAPSRPSTIYASTGDDTFRSTDGGDTWRAIRPGGAASLAVHPQRPSTVFAGGFWNTPPVRFTRDGGLTWREAEGVVSSDHIEDIEFEPGRPSRLHLLSPSLGIYRSADAGRTWAPATTDGTNLLATFEIDPRNPDTFFAAGGDEDGGVYRSRDRGKSWTRMGGMGHPFVSVLALPRSGRTLHAGTTDREESGQGLWSYRVRE